MDRPWLRFWPEGVPEHIDFPEVPVFALLTTAARRYPDKVAVTSREGPITYRELDEASDKLAAYLHEHGLNKSHCVALCLPNSREFMVSYYGILKSGATVTPINPMYREDEMKYQLNDCGAAAIITDQEHYPVVRAIQHDTRLKMAVLTDSRPVDGTISLPDILSAKITGQPSPDINPKVDVAAIQYTGGTTGFPKGAMLTHYNLVANAIQNAAWFKWNENDVVMGVLPFYHSWGACTCINSPVYAGCRVIAMRRFDSEELLRTIEREKATVLYGATTMFIMLTNSPEIAKFNISSLRYVKAGAMPIPPEIQARWMQRTGIKMLSGYGLSEASPETHNSPIDRCKPGTIGIPVIDTEARIVDDATGTRDMGTGQVGELIIRGPQVMKGYLNRPEDNLETLKNGWLYTGDLAVMDDEGYFKIVDRKKETIKFKGYTIAPAEVEAAIYEHPAVKECAVVGKPDPLSGEIPKAFVVLKEGCQATANDIIEFCEERVSPYKKVREVEFIDSIPKTPVGKVLRRILKARGM